MRRRCTRIPYPMSRKLRQVRRDTVYSRAPPSSRSHWPIVWLLLLSLMLLNTTLEPPRSRGCGRAVGGRRRRRRSSGKQTGAVQCGGGGVRLIRRWEMSPGPASQDTSRVSTRIPMGYDETISRVWQGKDYGIPVTSWRKCN